jgi:hypothetical protein
MYILLIQFRGFNVKTCDTYSMQYIWRASDFEKEHKFENTLWNIQEGNAQVMGRIPNMFKSIINYENALQQTNLKQHD